MRAGAAFAALPGIQDERCFSPAQRFFALAGELVCQLAGQKRLGALVPHSRPCAGCKVKGTGYKDYGVADAVRARDGAPTKSTFSALRAPVLRHSL